MAAYGEAFENIEIKIANCGLCVYNKTDMEIRKRLHIEGQVFHEHL